MTIFTYKTPSLRYETFVDDVSYTAQVDFVNGTLPLEKDVLCCMLYLLRPGREDQERSTNEAAEILAYNLIEHWHLLNIYTIPVSEMISLSFVAIQDKTIVLGDQIYIYNVHLFFDLFY